MKCFILFLLLPLSLNAQIITSFAGGGISIGDGGPATAAIIDNPAGCTFSKDGSFYVACGDGNRVRKIDTNGIITTIAGTGISGYSGDGGQATAANLKYPQDVTFDTAGNIFFSDAQNNVIRKIDAATGIITTVCGNGMPGSTGDGGVASAAKLYSPNGICFDKYGNLYIADLENNKVRKIDAFGIITTFAGTGIAGYNGDGIPAIAAKLYTPLDVVADDAGNIYIADGNSRLRKVNTTGIISTFAGNGVYSYLGDGMPATSAQFGPSYMKWDSLKNLYISDEGSNLRIFKIDTAGIFHCVAGNGVAANTGDGGPATAASMNYPWGLALDKCNNLYISNVGYNKIRKVTFDSACSIAGTVAIHGTTYLCVGATTHLSATTTGGTWSSSATGTATVGYGTGVVTGIAAGTAIITYTIGSIMDTVMVTVLTMPDAGIIMGSNSVCVGDSVRLFDTVANGVWSTSNTAVSTITGSGIVYGIYPGVDTISYKLINDDNGCLSAAKLSFTVLSCNDGIKSINKTGEGLISMTPNPAYNLLTVAATEKIINLTVSNLLGLVIYSNKYNSEIVQIDVSTLASGVYFVKINNNEVRKFVKQ